MIIIGNDHGGYKLKNEIIKYFDEIGIEYRNIGTDSEERTDCEIYAQIVAEAVKRKEADKGILICKTGNGMAMTANKYKGIRCALCYNEAIAKQAKEHLNANVIALPAEYIDDGEAIRIIRTWIASEFLGKKYAERLELLKEIEKENMK